MVAPNGSQNNGQSQEEFPAWQAWTLFGIFVLVMMRLGMSQKEVDQLLNFLSWAFPYMLMGGIVIYIVTLVAPNNADEKTWMAFALCCALMLCLFFGYAAHNVNNSIQATMKSLSKVE